jgi:hypothetical protein
MHRTSAANIATFTTASIMLPSTEKQIALEVLIVVRQKYSRSLATQVTIITVWRFRLAGHSWQRPRPTTCQELPTFIVATKKNPKQDTRLGFLWTRRQGLGGWGVPPNPVRLN